MEEETAIENIGNNNDSTLSLIPDNIDCYNDKHGPSATI